MKKIISIVLAAALILGSCCAVFAVNPEEHNVMLTSQKEKIRYLHLGDSLSNGFGLKAFEEIRKSYPLGTMENRGISLNNPQAYPALVAQKLSEQYGEGNVEWMNLAGTGMRAEDLAYLLSDDYPYLYDGYSAAMYGQYKYDIEVLKETPAYMDLFNYWFENADIVSVQIGANDFLNYINAYAHLDVSTDLKNYAISRGWENAWEAEHKIVSETVKALIGDDANSQNLTKLIDALTYAMLNFADAFDAFCRGFRQVNPYAKLYVLGLQHLIQDGKMSVMGINVPISLLQNLITNLADNYIKLYSNCRSQYEYIDISRIDVMTMVHEFYRDPSEWSEDAKYCADELMSDFVGVQPNEAAYSRISGLLNNLVANQQEANAAATFAPSEALKAYLANGTPLTPEEKTEAAMFLFRISMQYAHPNADGHKDLADKAYSAIKLSLDRENLYALKQEFRSSVQEQLQDMAEKRFEMKLDLAEGIRNSLKISVSNMRNAFNNLLVLPKLFMPFGK